MVSRLMVLPDHRRSGLGAALLETAAEAARERGLRPALDVVTTYRSAIRLYERLGWQRLGVVSLAMPDGERVDEYVYVAPAAQPVTPTMRSTSTRAKGWSRYCG